MATSMPERRDRYLYLGGSVDTARARARRLALVATVVYAFCLFGMVMLAHELVDREQPAAASVQARAQPERAHRF